LFMSPEPISDERLNRRRLKWGDTDNAWSQAIARIDAAEALAEERLREVERLRGVLEYITDFHPRDIYYLGESISVVGSAVHNFALAALSTPTPENQK
jgi:hypothetical protein